MLVGRFYSAVHFELDPQGKTASIAQNMVITLNVRNAKYVRF